MTICFYLPCAQDASALLCGYEQLLFLSRKGLLTLKTTTPQSNISDSYSEADAVFFSRSDSIYEVELARALQKNGKKLFYILDDDLLNVPEYIPSSAIFARKGTRKNITEMMTLCDYLVTPSVGIAEKYGDRFENVILIEEPALNSHAHCPTNERVTIGFAGSVDRTADVDNLLSESLLSIKQKYKERVSIEFFGIKPKVTEKLDCACIPRAKTYYGYHDVMKELNWDIGLAPMPDSSFHACKHYNKYIEYGAHGVISVCSNRLPYTKVIKNGENGILCDNNTEDWVNALSALIDSAEYRDEIRTRVESQIAEEFSIEAVSLSFWRQIEDLNLKTCGAHQIKGGLTEFRFRFLLYLDKIQEHRLRFPLLVLKRLYSMLKKCNCT